MIVFGDSLENFNKRNIISIFTKDLISTSSPIHNVVPCIRVLNPQWSGHDANYHNPQKQSTVDLTPVYSLAAFLEPMMPTNPCASR